MFFLWGTFLGRISWETGILVVGLWTCAFLEGSCWGVKGREGTRSPLLCQSRAS